MTLKIETRSDAFVIQSATVLMNLRCQFEDRIVEWHLEESANQFTYTITHDEFKEFFSVTNRIAADIVYDVDGKRKALSVSDFDLSFGDKLAFFSEVGTVSIYVSLASTIRIGWNWYGASEALIVKQELTNYEQTSSGLKLNLTIDTRYFKANAVHLYLQNGRIEKPIFYQVTDVRHTVLETGYRNDVTVLINNVDLMKMMTNVEIRAKTEVASIIKFKLIIEEERLTNQTVALKAMPELVDDDVLLQVGSLEGRDCGVIVKLLADRTFTLMPIVLPYGEMPRIQDELRKGLATDGSDYTVLVDEGDEADRQNIRLLFESLVAKKVSKVVLLTDGQFEKNWTDDELQQVVYLNTNEHVAISSHVKTLVYMGSYQDYTPLYGATSLDLTAKEHVVLLENLVDQQERRHFKFPAKGHVTFVVANKQNKHLLQQLYRSRTNIVLTGLPEYSDFEKRATGEVDNVVGLAVQSDLAKEIREIDQEVTFSDVDIDGNLHAYRVVMTDDYDVAKRVSVVGVPVVYINAALTPGTVDHFYYLTGPVIRDVRTGMPILAPVLNNEFNFSPYVEHGRNNLNECHDGDAAQRVLEILQ